MAHQLNYDDQQQYYCSKKPKIERVGPLQMLNIMKKITLLVASIILFGNAANATVRTRNTVALTNSFTQEEPIAFFEKGIQFFVFPSGEFDFNTHPQENQGDYFYKSATTATTYESTRRSKNYGVRIEHDSFGRIRRVGNTFINYDSRDRVNRIGSVFMRYNRWALTQIGGMQLVYNRRGQLVNTIGTVKGNQYGYCYTYHNDQDDYDNGDQSNEDSNDNYYYYYKANGSKAKVEDDK